MRLKQSRARRAPGWRLPVAAVAAALCLGGATSSPAARRPRAAVARPAADEGESFTIRDPRLGLDSITRYCQVYVPRNGTLAGPRQDPKFNQTFGLRCVVRAWEDPAGEKDVRFLVHFSEPGEEALARRVSGVLARVYWMGVEYLALPRARRGAPVDVWLTRVGKAGAEQFRNNIYVYGIAEDRAPAEWVREMAHEYSHIILPEVGPFTSPEKWANGYLGERLFLKWLIDQDQTGIWGTPFAGSAYLANQVYPLRDRFMNAGPASPDGQRTDAPGMQHYIGFGLAIEALYGPRMLREALRLAPSNAPLSLGAGLAQALAAASDVETAVDPRAYIPDRSTLESLSARGVHGRRAAYWLFLPAGTWGATLEGVFPPGLTAQLDRASTRLTSEATLGRTILQVRVDAAGWRRLEIAAGSGGPFELTRISVRRAGE